MAIDQWPTAISHIFFLSKKTSSKLVRLCFNLGFNFSCCKVQNDFQSWILSQSITGRLPFFSPALTGRWSLRHRGHRGWWRGPMRCTQKCFSICSSDVIIADQKPLIVWSIQGWYKNLYKFHRDSSEPLWLQVQASLAALAVPHNNW